MPAATFGVHLALTAALQCFFVLCQCLWCHQSAVSPTLQLEKQLLGAAVVTILNPQGLVETWVISITYSCFIFALPAALP
jgi:arginine exporter protein ArgO